MRVVRFLRGHLDSVVAVLLTAAFRGEVYLAERSLVGEVFVATLSLLYLSENQTASNGNALTGKLGDADLPFNSVEGHVASFIYGKIQGDTVFRRITPISKILEWANVCEIGKGCLRLK